MGVETIIGKEIFASACIQREIKMLSISENASTSKGFYLFLITKHNFYFIFMFQAMIICLFTVYDFHW